MHKIDNELNIRKVQIYCYNYVYNNKSSKWSKTSISFLVIAFHETGIVIDWIREKC